MNHPFEIVFTVEEINHSENNRNLIEAQDYHINVTLTHTIADLKHSVWINSENYALKPVFLTFKYGERKLNDNERLCDILQTPEVPLQPPSGFSLVVDHSLFHSRVIPQRDPDHELFDILVQLSDNSGVERTVRFRESLGTTVGDLKGYLIEESTKNSAYRVLSDSNFTLKLKSSGEVFNDNHVTLANLLHLDVTPLHPITFQVANTSHAEVPQVTNRRFHIKIDSDVATLQRENNLFEVNMSTTLQEFKRQIIDRMDHFSVRRTFEEQIKLHYQNEPISSDGTIVSLLRLNDELIAQNRIITLKLEVSDHPSGTSGLLSREFWNDLRSPNRFEFLPNTRTMHSATEHIQSVEPTASEPILPIEPTRIVIEDGVEWNLIGESYERIRPNRITSNDTPRDLLVDQSDLSSLDYEFTLQIGEEIKSVTLNTSQCIIVDKGTHTPYLLLSPSGAAKLCGQFHSINGEPLIQQVQVLMYTETSSSTESRGSESNQHISSRAHRTARTAPTPTVDTFQRNNARTGERTFSVIFRTLNTLFGGYQAIGTRAILFILKALVIINILGINIPSHLWKPALLYGLVLSQLYVLFFAGGEVATRIEESFANANENNESDTRTETPQIVSRVALGFAKFVRFTSGATSGITSSLRDELISILVNRTRDYEYILDGQVGGAGAQWWYSLRDDATNVWKDAVLWGLTFIPNWDGQIEDELEKWRLAELPELQRKVRLYAELVQALIDSYNQKFTPEFSLPSGLEMERMQIVLEESSGNEVQSQEAIELSENRFQVLVHYYRELERSFKVLNLAMVRDEPIENGIRIEEVTAGLHVEDIST